MTALDGFVNGESSPFTKGYYAGRKILLGSAELPGKAEFLEKLNAIANRADPRTPTVVFIARPPLDRRRNPKPQIAGAESTLVYNLNGKDFNVIVVTQYLKNGLTDGQLLALLSHESGHSRQRRDYRLEHPADWNLQHFERGKKSESDADAFALSCPEVDPRDFKEMLVATSRLNDEAGKKHPFLFKGSFGTTKFIPVSAQVKMELGWDHPLNASRIKMADGEIARRAAYTVSAGDSE
jgi:Zn-dependent protease with chaperone function